MRLSSAGPVALVAAIIGRAHRDALAGDRAARRWFHSAEYRHYCELVGVNPELLPEGITANVR